MSAREEGYAGHPSQADVDATDFDLANIQLSPASEAALQQRQRDAVFEKAFGITPSELEASAQAVAQERLRRAVAREQLLQPPVEVEPVRREIADSRVEITE